MKWEGVDVAQRVRRIIRGARLWLMLAVLGGTIFLWNDRNEYAWPFLGITAATMVGLEIWVWFGGRGLPFLPVLVLQHGAIYGFPLLVRNPILENYPVRALPMATFIIALTICFAMTGWRIGLSLIKEHPSKRTFEMGGTWAATRSLFNFALMLLIFGILFEVLGATGLIWKMLPGDLAGFIPVVRTFCGAATLLGGTLGGIVLPSPACRNLRPVFWLLLIAGFFLATRDLLVSGGFNVLAGTALGLGLGRARFPWRFILLAGLVAAFLNFGKVPMREKYWSEGNTTGVTLSQMPGFYLEWATKSLELMTGVAARTPGELSEREMEGQSLLERFSNLQNLLFAIDVLENVGYTTLNGQTYKPIPSLLIPRFLWPNKPRTHEGQVLLNVYFGRQASIEDTERTYVAWGLLPEAVGNFGPVVGAVVFGLFAGLACGMLEAWTVRKRLLSVGGLVGIAILLQLVNSFEMVASVFVTAVFQMVCAVAIGAFAIYRWSNRRPLPMPLRAPRRGASRQLTERVGDPLNPAPSAPRNP